MNSAPIFNANTLSLAQGLPNVPNMRSTLGAWFQTISFIKITKGQANFNLTETNVTTTFQGVRQPFTPQQLQMKPIGQRAWKWETIHAFPDLVLAPDDQMNFNGTIYRVDSKTDFTEYGYVLYEICQDYS